MEKKLITARTIAGILGAALVIALVVIWQDTQTIKDLKDPAKQNITLQGDTIRADCTSTDPVIHAKCADDLQHLSDLLSQFSKGVPTGAGTIKVNGAGSVQGGVTNVQTVPVNTK